VVLLGFFFFFLIFFEIEITIQICLIKIHVMLCKSVLKIVFLLFYMEECY